MFGHLAQSVVARVNYLESAFEHLLIALRSQSGRSIGARDRAYLQDGPRSLQSIGQRMDAEVRHVNDVIEISSYSSTGEQLRAFRQWVNVLSHKKSLFFNVGYVNRTQQYACDNDKTSACLQI